MLPLTAGISAVFSIEGLFCLAGAAPKLEYSNLVSMRLAMGFLWSNYAFYYFFFHLYHQFFSFLFSGQAEEMRHLITFDSSEKRPFFNIRVFNVVLNSAARLHEYKFDGLYQFLLNTRPFARKEIVKTA